MGTQDDGAGVFGSEIHQTTSSSDIIVPEPAVGLVSDPTGTGVPGDSAVAGSGEAVGVHGTESMDTAEHGKQ